MQKLGVIGLGMIGGGVAACLARNDRLTAVYDIRAEAAAKIPGAPACATSPAALAADCEIVFIAVINARQVEDLLSGDNGILGVATPPKTLILLSTVSLDELKKLSALAGEHGIKLIDCGVTGGPDAAAKGDLVCLVGAEESDFDALSDVFPLMSKSAFRMGDPGTGMAAKIARNIIVYTCWMAGREAARLASAAGVDPVVLAEVVDSSAENVGGPTTWLKRPPVAESEQERALREGVLVLLQKDLGAALELAGALNIALPGAEVALKYGAATLDIDGT